MKLNYVKQLRWNQGLNVRELAQRSGVHHGTITKVENFETMPRQDTMLKISRGLKMNTEEVFLIDWKHLDEL